MKKYYSIIALMLLFVGSAWGDNIIADNQTFTVATSYVSSISNLTSGYYVIQNQIPNGPYYMYQDLDATNTPLKRSGTKSTSETPAYKNVFKLTVTNTNGVYAVKIQGYNGNYLSVSTSGNTIANTEDNATTFYATKASDTYNTFYLRETSSGGNYLQASDAASVRWKSGTTGDWAQYRFYPVTVGVPIQVTYQVINANNTDDIWATETVTQIENSDISMPSALSNNLVTLSEPSGTIGEENTTITYQGTINLPFLSSSIDDATYQYMKINNGTKYVTYSADVTDFSSGKGYPASDNQTYTDVGEWAIVGTVGNGTNPYSDEISVKIYNKAVGTSSTLNWNSDGSSSPQFGDDGDNSSWVVSANSYGYTFHVSGTNQYMNDFAGYGVLGLWNDANAANGSGSAFAFEEVPEDPLADAKSNAETTIDTYLTNLSVLYTEEDASASKTEIENATTEEAINEALSTFYLKAAGKSFRLYNNYGRTIKPLVTIYDNGSQLALDTVSYQSEFQFEAYGSGLALKNVYTGRYVQDVSTSARISTGTDAKAFTFTSSSPNTIAIGQTGGYSFFHQDASGNIVGWEASAEASVWRIIAFSETDENVLSGSAYKVEKINSTIGTNWGDYKATDEYTEAYSAFTSDGGNTKANYKAVLDNLTEFVGSDGLVNIYNTNVTSSTYSFGLQSGFETSKAFGVVQNLNDASQMWIVTSPKQGYVNLFNVNAQKYLGSFAAGASVNLADTPTDWEIEWGTNNGVKTFTLYSNYNSSWSKENNHLQLQTGTDLGRLNPWSSNDDWAYIDVKEFSITVHTVGDYSYATICYPFSLTLSDGEGYTGNINTETGNLTLTSIGQTIPAGTPVVVVVDNATTTSITATINDGKDTEVSPLASSALSGTYLPKTIAEDGELTLGVYDNAAGFYHWGGTIQNKAYLNSSATSKGFAFSFGDDDPTGISEELIKEAVKELQGQRYNVQGQPVGADYKGIIIQNGKKYLHK